MGSRRGAAAANSTASAWLVYAPFTAWRVVWCGGWVGGWVVVCHRFGTLEDLDLLLLDDLLLELLFFSLGIGADTAAAYSSRRSARRRRAAQRGGRTEIDVRPAGLFDGRFTRD